MFFGPPPDEANAQQCVEAVDTFWTALATVINTDVSATIESAVTVLDETTGQPINVLSTSGGTVDFTNNIEILPFQTQGLIRWNTGQFANGRQIVGHTFVPGPCENANDAGVPNAAYRAALQTAADGLISDIDQVFEIYSRRNLRSDAALNAVVGTKWATLKSRRD